MEFKYTKEEWTDGVALPTKNEKILHVESKTIKLLRN